MSSTNIRYLVFDVESVADAPLVAQMRFPEESKAGLAPLDAVRKWKEQLTAETGKDFIPYTYHIPTAVVLAKVSEEFELLDLAALSEVTLRPEEIVERFWRGWERYGRPTFVTFNGRSFDLPLMELSAFRYGLAIPGWFSPLAKNYDQPRSRFNQSAHIDLQDVFTNFGTTRFSGGLNLAANLIGKPGKMEVQGQMVEEMHAEGQLQEIEDYCRCDVLDTYFVFLRTRVMMGYLTLSEEQKRVDFVRKWLEERADSCAGYRLYLEKWGRWQNPWDSGFKAASPSEKNRSVPETPSAKAAAGTSAGTAAKNSVTSGNDFEDDSFASGGVEEAFSQNASGGARPQRKAKGKPGKKSEKDSQS